MRENNLGYTKNSSEIILSVMRVEENLYPHEQL